MPRLLRVLVLLTGTVLFVAACGDDDATDASPSTLPSEERDDTGASTVPDRDDDAGTGEPDPDTGSSSSVPDAEAEDPTEESGNEEEGLGDPAVFVADLSGDAEVPGPGHGSASGRMEAESDLSGNLCFDMVAEGLGDPVTGAHIHEGAGGTAGGVVLSIGNPTDTSGGTDTWSDVCVPVSDEIIGRLFSAPENFHADVHTASLPDGAIRGQLSLATIFDLTLS